MSAAPLRSVDAPGIIRGDPARDVRARRLFALLAVTACAYYAVAASATAWTRLPFVDEGTFVGSAVNIVRTGHSGNPSTPPWGLGIPLPESRIYNFWVLPGYLYTLASWFHAFPETLRSARALSVIAGIAALFLFYRLVRALSASRALAAVSTAVLATDFNMIARSSVARMDTISLALNLSSWLAYLGLRKRSIPAALAASFAIGSAGLLFHPNAMFAFGGVAILAFTLDRGRIRIPSALPSALAGLAPLGLMIPVILQAPAIWEAQMRSHTQGRFAAFLRPIWAVQQEFMGRYYYPFGGADHFPPNAGRMMLLLVLGLYGAAVVLAIATLKRGGRAQKIVVALFAMTTLYFTFFENGKFFPYNIHVLPWFAFCLALAVCSPRFMRYRKAAVAAVLFAVLVNAAATLAYIHENRYARNYLPVLNLLKRDMGPHDLVITHAYFGLPLGFARVSEDYTLVDVVRRRPKFVILNTHFGLAGVVKCWPFGPDPVAAGLITAQEKRRASQMVQSDYGLVLKNSDYAVYRRID